MSKLLLIAFIYAKNDKIRHYTNSKWRNDVEPSIIYAVADLAPYEHLRHSLQ